MNQSRAVGPTPHWHYWGAGVLAIGIAFLGIAATVSASPKASVLWMTWEAIVAYVCFALAILCGIAGVRQWRFPLASRRSPSEFNPADLLRAQYKKGRELQQSLVWPLDGAPENRDHAAEQTRRAHRIVRSWAKSTWRNLNDYFPAHEADFYGPGDRSLGPSFFFMSCDQEIDEAGGPSLYLERKLEFIARLLKQIEPKRAAEDGAFVFDAGEAQKRLQTELSALMHDGTGYTDVLIALKKRGVNDLTIIEASDLSWGIDAWLDEGLEWVRREKPELLGLLTPVSTPTPPVAMEVLPPLVERRARELRDIFYRL